MSVVVSSCPEEAEKAPCVVVGHVERSFSLCSVADAEGGMEE